MGASLDAIQSVSIMFLKWSVTFLAITLLAGQAIADDQQQKKEVAEDKAQVLEHKAAEKGGDGKPKARTPPTCKRSPAW